MDYPSSIASQNPDWDAPRFYAAQVDRTPSRDAFTLAELLVVIGVVALLVVLMVPAMAGTADRSKRARCQSNLRQIGVGVTMYAGNNNGRIFSSHVSGPNYVQIALAPPVVSAANSAGLRLETNGVWTCPNRPGFPFFDPPSNAHTIGYQYFGGIGTWSNPAGFFTSRSPANLNAALPHWALAADVVMKVNGVWGGATGAYTNLPAHGTGDTALPQGGNHVFADGSVQWVQAEEMFFLSSWNTTSRLAYWYQDPKDFEPALKSFLSTLRFRP